MVLLNASRLVHEAYLKIALRKKPEFFADVVRYAQVKPVTDEMALANMKHLSGVSKLFAIG